MIYKYILINISDLYIIHCSASQMFFIDDVKSRFAGAGFPVMNTGQAVRRPTDSKTKILKIEKR